MEKEARITREEIIERNWKEIMSYPDGKPRICQGCGYSKTTDQHHYRSKKYVLCPNCHALITRGIASLTQVLSGPK